MQCLQMTATARTACGTDFGGVADFGCVVDSGCSTEFGRAARPRRKRAGIAPGVGGIVPGKGGYRSRDGQVPCPKWPGIVPRTGAYHSQLQNSVHDCRRDTLSVPSCTGRFERCLKNRISLFNGSGQSGPWTHSPCAGTGRVHDMRSPEYRKGLISPATARCRGAAGAVVPRFCTVAVGRPTCGRHLSVPVLRWAPASCRTRWLRGHLPDSFTLPVPASGMASTRSDRPRGA